MRCWLSFDEEHITQLPTQFTNHSVSNQLFFNQWLIIHSFNLLTHSIAHLINSLNNPPLNQVYTRSMTRSKTIRVTFTPRRTFELNTLDLDQQRGRHNYNCSNWAWNHTLKPYSNFNWGQLNSIIKSKWRDAVVCALDFVFKLSSEIKNSRDSKLRIDVAFLQSGLRSVACYVSKDLSRTPFCQLLQMIYSKWQWFFLQ